MLYGRWGEIATVVELNFPYIYIYICPCFCVCFSALYIFFRFCFFFIPVCLPGLNIFIWMIWFFFVFHGIESNIGIPLNIKAVKDRALPSLLCAKHPKHPRLGSVGVNIRVETESKLFTSKFLSSSLILKHELFAYIKSHWS